MYTHNQVKGNRMQVEAGMAWSDIAGSAYRAYAANRGNKDYRGEELPAWDVLPEHIRSAWEAAVRQVDFCLTKGRHGNSDVVIREHEQKWTGWTPPK